MEVSEATSSFSCFFKNKLTRRVVLDVQRSCEESTEFPYSLHPVSPTGNILRWCVHLSQLISQS